MTMDACPRAALIAAPPTAWPKVTRLLAIVTIVVVVALMVIATRQLFYGLGVENWVVAFWRTSPLAVPMVMAIFIVLSFAAVPQFVLISMCVVVFGPFAGFGIAWSATVLSAGLGFYIGPLIRKAGLPLPYNPWFDRVMACVARNGFWSALFVRFIPSGPFVLVNMALGVSRTPMVPFLCGTGIGILPKAILIALTGSGLVQLAQGRYQTGMLVLAIIALIWVVLTALRQGLGHNADKTRENCVPKP